MSLPDLSAFMTNVSLHLFMKKYEPIFIKYLMNILKL